MSSTASLAQSKAQNLRRLDAVGLNRTQTGYYYIAHYYPLRAMEETTVEEARRLLQSVDARAGFETYVHFPFCEVICSFCHFLKERTTGTALQSKEDELLAALKVELDLHGAILGKPRGHSLQLGGGTPSLMSNAGLKRVLEWMHERFVFDPGAEKKIELFPKRYDKAELREKLRILRDYGFTDIVIDIESGNQSSLNFIGRPISNFEAYLELVEEVVAAGFKSIVSALMLGLPHETFESLERTVRGILAVPEIQVVNTFPTIIRAPDPMLRQLQRHPEWFPDAETRDAMWIFARNLFREAGFVEGPISYLHRPSKRPAQQADKFECVNLLGFGPSAFGYWNGDDWAAQCFNYCNLDDYYSRIRHGELALWRAGVMDQEERARRKLIFGLANCKTEDLVVIERRFGVSIDAIYGQTLNALLQLDLIEIDKAGRGVHYTEDGLCRLEEISFFLGSDYVSQRAGAPVPAGPYQAELLRHHYYYAMATEQQASWQRFVASQSRNFMVHLQ